MLTLSQKPTGDVASYNSTPQSSFTAPCTHKGNFPVNLNSGDDHHRLLSGPHANPNAERQTRLILVSGGWPKVSSPTPNKNLTAHLTLPYCAAAADPLF